MCASAGADFVRFENFVEEVDYLPDEVHEAGFMTVAGAIVDFVVIGICLVMVAAVRITIFAIAFIVIIMTLCLDFLDIAVTAVAGENFKACFSTSGSSSNCRSVGVSYFRNCRTTLCFCTTGLAVGIACVAFCGAGG